MPLPTAAGAAGSVLEVLASIGAAWVVLAHAGRAGELSPIRRTLGENRCVLVEDNRVDGLADDWGGFLGLLNDITNVGREPWCSREPRRALVTAIILWETACVGTIGGLVWTGVGLHTLHARMVCTALGCHEGYRPGGHGGPHVFWGPPQTSSQTAFVHFLIRRNE